MPESEPALFRPLGSVAPWFGAKRSLAPRVVEEFGPHVAYWEPFCGSMAVLFAKSPCAQEVVNDLNRDLINLARCLADADLHRELYDRATRVLYHEELFREAVARHFERSKAESRPAEPCLDAALDFLICSWQGMSGFAGSARRGWSLAVRHTIGGTGAAPRWVKAVESIPFWHERLRTVTILNRDAFAVLDRIGDESRTVIYCDPPYVVKNGEYLHDFADSDHDRLAAALRRFVRARVVVSYYDHPKLEDLYQGWRKRPIDVVKSMANGNIRPGSTPTAEPKIGREILLINDRQGRLF